MLKVKLTTIGNSVGIILPKESLAKMKVGKGDTLFLAEEAAGYSLSPYEKDFDQQVKIAESVMNKYRNALHELAK
jgi:putative addiction module antidote